MSIPYQCLSRLGKGSLLCAARGCSIQTFDLKIRSNPLTSDPQFLSSWSHPFARQQTEKSNPPADEAQAEGNGEQPPSKRRKVDSEDAEPSVEEENAQGTAGGTGEKGQQKKNKVKGQPAKSEPPFVVLLTATEDGSHVIAVTGQDKTLWVFEHDGKGSLKEISQRAMPKRPCSLALAEDGQTILSADKFGDVYALPLIPSPDEENTSGAKSKSASASASASASSTPAPTTSQPSRGANTFTVHSQRNRRALEDQMRQLEANARRDVPKDGPSFAHQILLGHVSMLTSVATAKDDQSRPYIITGDRDEHIRVSRGIPQTHVIERFCLGHSSFVNALCVLPDYPGTLISGGGDNELFTWDWLKGELLGKTDLLSHVRKVQPDASKVAVSKILPCPVDGLIYLVVLCERVPALFTFVFDLTTVSHMATHPLRGNPLDVTAVGEDLSHLVVAVDADESLAMYAPGGTSWEEQKTIQGSAAAGTGVDASFSRQDLDKALYTVENLRKTDFDEAGDEPADEAQVQSQTQTQTSEQGGGDTKME